MKMRSWLQLCINVWHLSLKSRTNEIAPSVFSTTVSNYTTNNDVLKRLRGNWSVMVRGANYFFFLKSPTSRKLKKLQIYSIALALFIFY